MCRFASFVLTKDRELWFDHSDSHTDIIEQFDLVEMGARGPNILRVEIFPGPMLKKFSDLAGWIYRVDQDLLPEWHDPTESERRTRQALARRFKAGFVKVDARRCTALTSLDAPKASTVYASGCTALTSLDAPNASYVYASGCTALTELKADAADYVDASGCTALRRDPSK